jgi:Plavaka transposase
LGACIIEVDTSKLLSNIVAKDLLIRN